MLYIVARSVDQGRLAGVVSTLRKGMMTRTTIHPSILVALLASVLVGTCACSTKIKPYECPALVSGTGVDAQQLWDCNREIIMRTVKGKRFTIREFEGAAEFFESVTGIPADVATTPSGAVPGKSIKQDLGKWDAWLDGHRIYWDPASNRIRAEQDGSA